MCIFVYVYIYIIGVVVSEPANRCLGLHLPRPILRLSIASCASVFGYCNKTATTEWQDSTLLYLQ